MSTAIKPPARGLPPKLPGLPSLPPNGAGSDDVSPDPNRSITIKKGSAGRGIRAVVYGIAGIGKTSLSSLAPDPIVIDTDSGAHHVDVPRIDDIKNYDDLRYILNSNEVRNFKTIIIDSATQVQELIAARIIATIPLEKGGRAKNLEDYGYGKGYNHLYEHFIAFLQGLEAISRRGQNVIVVAHNCMSTVLNPDGEDWTRYEPRLWKSKNGNSDLRQRLQEWSDYMFFIQYDIAVKGGKGTGSGSRTVWAQEQGFCMAKSRPALDPWVFNEGNTELWDRVFSANGAGNGTLDQTNQGEQ